MRKSVGPRTDPCGTPDVTDAVSDVAVSTTTCSYPSVKKEFIQDLVLPSIPSYLRLRKRRSCSDHVRGLSQKVVDFCYNTRLCIGNSLKYV